MLEVWKDMEHYEGLYMISNFGNVKSLDRVVKQKNSFNTFSVRKYVGKPIKFRIASNGYYYFHVSKGGTRKTFKPHRLVAIHFISNDSNLPEVNHKDGNKLNNHKDNLEWVTSSQNKQHAIDTGLKINSTGIEAHAVKTKLEVYKSGQLVAELYGEKQLNDFGLTSSGVWSTINKKQASHRGYTFKRVNI